jgi:carbon-monoxide dehydrogenase large subunit
MQGGSAVRNREVRNQVGNLAVTPGAKGIGEAGLIGAMGAVWVAVNDALKPFGARIQHQPFTPERILDALARARV